MIVEERNYTLVPGGVPRYLEQWGALGRAAQVARLGEPLGVHTVEIGQLNTLVYWWQFSDLSDRAVRRAALADDPEFAAFRREVRNLLISQSNRILIATPESSGCEPR
jgi:hypothetical protein